MATPIVAKPVVPTSGVFTDERDSQNYKWVKIGSQIWMAQNLNYTTNTHSRIYNNNDSNGQLYGRLYSFDVLLQACPKGWHVPTDTEWMLLEKDLGLAYAESGAVGSRGDIAKKFLPGGIAGFNVLFGGWYTADGHFADLGLSAYFWSSTGYGTPIAYHQIKKNKTGVYRNIIGREYGLSLRCVKDYW
jgi:uncharacterized protein (TIGR02145 family)